MILHLLSDCSYSFQQPHLAFIQHLDNGSIFLPLRHNKCMKLLNNHYFSTLSCYNTRLLDSLQAKFLRLPSRSTTLLFYPAHANFQSVRKQSFRFPLHEKPVFFCISFSLKRCKECALATIPGVLRGRLRHVSASRERILAERFCFIGRNFP